MKILFALALTVAAYGQPTPPSVPDVDAPELAARGKYSVGVRTVEITIPGAPDILHFDSATGKAPLYDRPLTLEIWYPATIPSGQAESVYWDSPVPNAPAGKTFRLAGKALRDAPPVRGAAFPLVIVSHGYPGSRTFMSYLSENLASKGYVVAAIDHTDSVWGAVRGFPSTLLNRSNDQLSTIEILSERAKQPGDFLNGVVDSSRVAVIGYSMGGYGALATAGAPYSKSSAMVQAVPGGYFEPWTEGSAAFAARDRSMIKAVVAIAPWGNQPPYNGWDASGLAGIRIPALFVVGDQDDVSVYGEGVKKAFEGAVNSERWMLVYQNARHNVGGNPAPPEAMGDFATRAFFDEPVWRKERICEINQHFVTAFLDLWLKGKTESRAYLDVAGNSNDGKWAAGPGAAAAFSSGVDSAGNRYWKGFQRRWALGLEMHHTAAAKKQ